MMAFETKQGADGFRKFSYKFKELVGVTYRDGTWVSTNEVSCNEKMSIKVGKCLPEEHPEKWMEYLSPDVTEQTQMKDLVIPGSHDSASFDLDPGSGRANDVTSYIELAEEKFERWFKTQNLDFTEQLKIGVRYFDLRTIKHPVTGNFHFVHGLFSHKTVEKYLKDIRRFLDKNKKEVVLLDFNHFYNMRKYNHRSLCTIIEKSFNEMMLNRKKSLYNNMTVSKITLSKLLELNARVIVLYGSANKCKDHEHIWSRDEVDILWPFTANKYSVVDNLIHEYKNLSRKDIIVVWPGILTPFEDDYYLERMKSFSNLHEFVTPILEIMVKWIKSRPNIPFNIISADFVEEHDFIKTVIRANNKSL
ncbi:unnamed protein product [Mytilus edulis]|uniref:Phosphatidylinositol-specific phospholipase C X domain-containing protein n=1 Tax=Mytilus edulis TaxID=6550 RepID=A0A8S3QK77_MYTED|nr:unnamed protein product [Mytilus edulis]